MPMRKKLNKSLLSFFVTLAFILPYTAFAQQDIAKHERMVPLKGNGVLQRLTYDASVLRTSTSVLDTLELPFFDDFSRESAWPNPTMWSDSSVYVNYGFGINPPTVGCATFDGLDKFGNAYNNVNAGAAGLCDVFTSKPLDLFDDENGVPYLSSDSLFFVFYYQRKGRGDNPEATDSLSLQFFNVANQTWQSVWSANGTSAGDTVFTKVRISINNPVFRQTGFKFRFRNFGSQNGMLDIWNVDYVYLNKFLPPDYDLIRDYAFVNQGFSLINGYSAVPWVHYNGLSSSQKINLIDNSAQLLVRNNNDGSPFPLSVSGKIVSRTGNQTQLFGGGGANSIIIPSNTNTVPPSNYTPSVFFDDLTAVDQTYFDAVYSLGQTSGGIPDDFTINDTLVHRQHFYDYYAHDDGSAELAYGINGINAKLAYRFDLLQADTLRGINMFFAQSGTSVASQQFRLAIWSGNASGPQGNPVYEKFNQTPMYVDSLNKFKTYLTDPVYLTAGTWYFGFIQNNSVLLNIGLDINTPADPSKKYFNTSGNWVQSQLPGMWMIRPVFSGQELYTSNPSVVQQISPLNIYPNPADDYFQVQPTLSACCNSILEIMDISGRMVYKTDNIVSPVIVSELANGTYTVRISDYDNGTIRLARLVVQHP